MKQPAVLLQPVLSPGGAGLHEEPVPGFPGQDIRPRSIGGLYAKGGAKTEGIGLGTGQGYDGSVFTTPGIELIGGILFYKYQVQQLDSPKVTGPQAEGGNRPGQAVGIGGGQGQLFTGPFKVEVGFPGR